MDEKTANNLYRLFPLMFRIELFGAALIFFDFVFYFIFGGAYDLTGDEILGDWAVLIGLPLVFILTLLTYLLYPMLKKQNLIPGMLIFTTVFFNALLSIPILIMMFSLFLQLVDILIYNS